VQRLPRLYILLFRVSLLHIEIKTEVAMDWEFHIPAGTTVFEYIKVGGYCCTTSGYLLYSDGRVYSIHGGRPEDGCQYVLEGIHKTLLEQVEAFIRGNWDAIQKLPEEIADVVYCDGYFQTYKFLSKQCQGEMMQFSEDGKEVLSYVKVIEDLFRLNAVHGFE
jgi:N-acetylneuraminic acid mutarotase